MVPPRVTAVARKRSRSFCQKRRWQVTAKYVHTLDPTKLGWADFLSKHCVGAYQGNGLTCNCRLSSLSQCGLIPGLKSEMDVRGLISLKKKKKKKKERKKKKCRQEIIRRISLQNPRLRRKPTITKALDTKQPTANKTKSQQSVLSIFQHLHITH